MRLVLRILVLSLIFGFALPGINTTANAQKSSIRYSDPKKDTKKEQKRLRKEQKLNEKRRAKQFKEKGLGANKKAERTSRKANKKKDKAGSYLDRVLTDKKEVSPQEKKAAYRRDRQLARSNNQRKSKMTRNRIKKRKPPKRKN